MPKKKGAKGSVSMAQHLSPHPASGAASADDRGEDVASSDEADLTHNESRSALQGQRLELTVLDLETRLRASEEAHAQELAALRAAQAEELRTLEADCDTLRTECDDLRRELAKRRTEAVASAAAAAKPDADGAICAALRDQIAVLQTDNDALRSRSEALESTVALLRSEYSVATERDAATRPSPVIAISPRQPMLHATNNADSLLAALSSSPMTNSDSASVGPYESLSRQIETLEEANRLLREQLSAVRGAKASAEMWHPASLASTLTSYVWDASRMAYKAVSTATHHLQQHTRTAEGVYTTLEQEQMITVHVCYKKFISPEVPDVLRMESEYFQHVRDPALVPKRRTFNLREWSYRMGDGPLHELAMALCEAICAYQLERDSRNFGMAGNGYLDDPTNLVLFEMKTWLADTASHAELTGDTMNMLTHRRRFVEELLRADIFPSGERSKISFKYVLQDAKSTLERAEAMVKAAVGGQDGAVVSDKSEPDWAVI